MLDILESIERIEKYAAAGRASFEKEELIQVWVLHHLQILGEAINSLRPDLQARFPKIPWAPIVGMRNVLVHQYFDIDTDIVWSVVERELPNLKVQFQEILDGWNQET